MIARAARSRPRSTPHPIARFRERYGRALTLVELRAIERRCLAGEGIVLRYSNASHHALPFAGMVVVCVLKRNRVATFLPADALDQVEPGPPR